MGIGKTLLGLLAGAAIGTVIGILIAPEKGEVTRKKMKEEGESFADSIGKRINDLVDSVTGKAAQAMSDMDNEINNRTNS